MLSLEKTPSITIVELLSPLPVGDKLMEQLRVLCSGSGECSSLSSELLGVAGRLGEEF